MQPLKKEVLVDQARDFFSDEAVKTQEYFVYFKF